MDLSSIIHLRDRLWLNDRVSDEDIPKFPYLELGEGSAEHEYLHARRQALHGYLPQRLPNFTGDFHVPELSDFESLLGEQSREISSTLAFVRALNILLKDKAIGDKIVPIIADEARTFGMEGLFRQIGIYNPHGQNYVPQDREGVSYYKEDESGQVLQEGINELGAISSWVAAATSYSTHDLPMVPFYIFYSMFGFQRVGDMTWLAGDQQARGFLLGATAGRTTLNGEGLQHQDGHSHLAAAATPNIKAYDVAYGYEIATIVHHGLKEMCEEDKDVVYSSDPTTRYIQQLSLIHI